MEIALVYRNHKVGGSAIIPITPGEVNPAENAVKKAGYVLVLVARLKHLKTKEYEIKSRKPTLHH